MTHFPVGGVGRCRGNVFSWLENKMSVGVMEEEVEIALEVKKKPRARFSADPSNYANRTKSDLINEQAEKRIES